MFDRVVTSSLQPQKQVHFMEDKVVQEAEVRSGDSHRPVMKHIFRVLKVLINIIALLVLASGIVLTILGGYDFVMVFSHFDVSDSHSATRLMVIGLLHAVDLFFGCHCLLRVSYRHDGSVC